MIYLLFKNQWVEHTPEYLHPDFEKARLEPTLVGQHHVNTKNQRYLLKDGKPLIKLSDIMTRDLLHVSLKTPIKVCSHIMNHEGVHHLAVFDDGQFCGIISDRDLRTVSKLSNLDKILVEQIETTVVMGASIELTVGQASLIMKNESINCLPLLDEDLNLAGIVTSSDLLRVLSNLVP
ncbi:MAG: hypothetical protein COW01_04940 [Bdellovibrionales bacterium CG12_big_fil_rev_8_21_14_0_65_38_15]|nr:MAG: hypothetical protein COW79_14220 [Bdellovibrionales bacterium CG22_combo_CG10-13_8_21_14_all_38_13]PIQ56230.1 MAG: hypothetical protein COW01_04940 [Bdellovibrionales bacterium CG12_big_fil_rev_8_21_14_0_65_38_15]PIR30374.1 MAG: hypothetical protein COV38_06385 [Bdellovibrionales bacterium CG11_big_fil_rev_8_21_14_0_20_38_13]